MNNRHENRESKQATPDLIAHLEKMIRGEIHPIVNEIILESSVDGYGTTPLLWAAKKGHTDLFKFLIEIGANLNDKDTDNFRSKPKIIRAASMNAQFQQVLSDHLSLDSKLAEKIKQMTNETNALVERKSLLGKPTQYSSSEHKREVKSENNIEQKSNLSAKSFVSKNEDEVCDLINLSRVLTSQIKQLEQCRAKVQSHNEQGENIKELERLSWWINLIDTHLKMDKEKISPTAAIVLDTKHSSLKTMASASSQGHVAVKITGEGSCLYKAVSHFIGEEPSSLRDKVASKLKKEKDSKEYKQFFEHRSKEAPEKYFKDIRAGRNAAGSAEIKALGDILHRPIIVINSAKNPNDTLYNLGNTAGVAEREEKEKPIYVECIDDNYYAVFLFDKQAYSECLADWILQKINSELKKADLSKLPLIQKIELRATINSLLVVARKKDKGDNLFTDLRLFLQERETLLAYTLWDYCFTPHSLSNRLCYAIAEKLLPLIPETFINGKPYALKEMDLLLQKVKAERRPKHASHWFNEVEQHPFLPSDPAHIIRWQGEIQDWEQIINTACSNLKDNETQIARIFLRTDTKSSESRPDGTSGKSLPLPPATIEMLRRKGPACRALVEYVYTLPTITDISKPFYDLQTGLREGSIKGTEVKGKGTEYVAGAAANKALAVFFEWWNKLPNDIKNRMGQLTTYFDSGYGNAALNGRKSINDLLKTLQTPPDPNDPRTCVLIISENLLKILKDNEKAIGEIEGWKSPRKCGKDIDTLRDDACQEIVESQSLYISYLPLSLEDCLITDPDTITSLLTFKLMAAIRSRYEEVVEEILLDYPNLLEANVGGLTMYGLIQRDGSDTTKNLASPIWKKRQVDILQSMIEVGNIDGVKQILDGHPDLLNLPLPNGLTPLAYSLSTSLVITENWLLTENIDPSIADPLNKSLEIAENLLLRENIDPFMMENEPSKCAVDLLLPLARQHLDADLDGIWGIIKPLTFLAACKNKITSLLKMVSLVSDSDKIRLLNRPSSYYKNNTLLISAASCGCAEAVEYLLSQEVDPFFIGWQGKTARQLAQASRERPEMTADYNYPAVRKLLLDQELHLLQDKIISSELKEVEKVFASSPDLRSQTLPNGFTSSEFYELRQLQEMIKIRNLDGVKNILHIKPHLFNAILPNGLTPLAYAIQGASWAIAEFLLAKREVDPFIAEGDPVKCAVDLLLTAAEKPDAQMDFIEELIRRLASKAVRNDKPVSLRKMVRQKPGLLEHRDSHYSSTLLILAASSGYQRSVECLLSEGADPFVVGGGNETARQWVRPVHGQPEVTAEYNYPLVRKLLLDRELEILQEWIQSGLEDNFIRASKALTISPDLRTKKLPNGLTIPEFRELVELEFSIKSGEHQAVEKTLKRVPQMLGQKLPNGLVLSKDYYELIVFQNKISACDYKKVSETLTSKPDWTNITLPNGLTPLALSIRNAQEKNIKEQAFWDITRYLLTHKNINPFIAEDDPIQCPVDLLLAAVDVENAPFFRPMLERLAFLAAYHDKPASLKKIIEKMPELLNYRSSKGNTLLIIAAHSRSLKSVEYLLSKNVDPFEKGEKDKTARQMVKERLQKCPNRSYSQISELLLEEELEIFEEMNEKNDKARIEEILASSPDLLDKRLRDTGQSITPFSHARKTASHASGVVRIHIKKTNNPNNIPLADNPQSNSLPSSIYSGSSLSPHFFGGGSSSKANDRNDILSDSKIIEKKTTMCGSTTSFLLRNSTSTHISDDSKTCVNVSTTSNPFNSSTSFHNSSGSVDSKPFHSKNIHSSSTIHRRYSSASSSFSTTLLSNSNRSTSMQAKEDLLQEQESKGHYSMDEIGNVLIHTSRQVKEYCLLTTMPELLASNQAEPAKIEKILPGLIKIRNGRGLPLACMVSTGLGADSSSHFITLIVMDKTLLVIDPRGYHSRHLEQLQSIKDKCKLDKIIISKNELQAKNDNSSCGPISTEIAIYTAQMEPSVIGKMLNNTKTLPVLSPDCFLIDTTLLFKFNLSAQGAISEDDLMEIRKRHKPLMQHPEVVTPEDSQHALNEYYYEVYKVQEQDEAVNYKSIDMGDTEWTDQLTDLNEFAYKKLVIVKSESDWMKLANNELGIRLQADGSLMYYMYDGLKESLSSSEIITKEELIKGLGSSSEYGKFCEFLNSLPDGNNLSLSTYYLGKILNLIAKSSAPSIEVAVPKAGRR